MVVTERRRQELESIPCIRGFREKLEDSVLSGELEISDGTIDQYICEVELFHRQSGIPYDQVPTKVQALKWRREAMKRYSKKTQAKKVSGVNHYLRLYHGLNWHLPLPKHIKRKSEPQALTQERVFDMVSYHERRNKHTKSMLIYIAYTCACRAEALLNIKLCNIDKDNRTIYLERTKEDKSRTVPLSKKSMAKLQEYIDLHRPTPKSAEDEPYLFIQETKRNRASYGYLLYAVKQSALKLGIETSVYPHILRHSRIRELRSRGYSWEKIMALTGHGDIRSLGDYIHSETVEGLQDALDKDEVVAPTPPQELQYELLMRENERLKLELENAQLKLQNETPRPIDKTPKHDIGYM